MTEDDLIAKSDRMFHNYGDILIKVFSILVALFLLGLYFLSTQRLPSGNNVNDMQNVNQ